MSPNIHVRMFINMFNHVLVSTKRHKRFSPSLSRSTQVSEEHVVVQHTTHHDGTVSTRDANGRIHLCQALCVASLLLFFGAAVWCSERGRSRTSGATCRAHACSNHNAVEKNSRWHMRPFRQLAPWTFSWLGGPKKIVLGTFCLSVDVAVVQPSELLVWRCTVEVAVHTDRTGHIAHGRVRPRAAVSAAHGGISRTLCPNGPLGRNTMGSVTPPGWCQNGPRTATSC
jgi:hypothetical protein